jgi:protein-tyrosine-phosphatase
MPPQVYNVLFVCADESARGLIAQAILNRWAGDRFRAWCTSGEAAEVHPLAVELLKSHQLWNGQRGAQCEQFTGSSAPAMDFVISVGEKLPDGLWSRFPDSPVKAQWRITDPAAVKGDPVRCKAAFRRSFIELENRIRLFVLAWGNSFKARKLAA